MLQLRSAIHTPRHAPATLAAPVIVVPVPAPAPVPGPPGYYPPAGPSRSPLSPLAWAVLAGVAYAGVVAGGAWLFFTVRRALGPATPQRSRVKKTTSTPAAAPAAAPASAVDDEPLKPSYTKRREETPKSRGVGNFEQFLDVHRPREVAITLDKDPAFVRAAVSRGYKFAGRKEVKVDGVVQRAPIYKREA